MLVIGCKDKCPQLNPIHTKLNSHTVDINDQEILYSEQQKEEYYRNGKITTPLKKVKNPPTFKFDITDEESFKTILIDSEIFKKNGKYKTIVLEYLPNDLFLDTVFKNLGKIIKTQGKLKIMGLPNYLLIKNSKEVVGPLFWSKYDISAGKNWFSKFFTFKPVYSYLNNQNLKENIWLKGAPYSIKDELYIKHKNLIDRINKKYANLSFKQKNKMKKKNDVESKIKITNYFKKIGFIFDELNINQNYIVLIKSDL